VHVECPVIFSTTTRRRISTPSTKPFEGKLGGDFNGFTSMASPKSERGTSEDFVERSGGGNAFNTEEETEKKRDLIRAIGCCRGQRIGGRTGTSRTAEGEKSCL